MASLEQRGNCFRVSFRLGGRKHHVSVKSTDRKDAEACLVRLEENLRLVERGRIRIPDGADVGLFLLSDGKLEKPVELARPARLGEMFATYREQFTAGAKEVITRKMEDIHMNHLTRLIGGETPVTGSNEPVPNGRTKRTVAERRSYLVATVAQVSINCCGVMGGPARGERIV